MCNDHRNGHFRGRACQMSFEPIGEDGRALWTLELDHDDFQDGARLTVDDSRMLLLHRVHYPFLARHCWVGNWCWDAFTMRRPRALQLVHAALASKAWSISGGPAHVVQWAEQLRAT